MADGFQITVDADAVLAAFERMTPGAEAYVKEACHVTADNVVREAKARLDRQLGPNATGKTEAGIHAQENYAKNGYVVLTTREPYPILPYWIEKGTAHQRARPYFDVSAKLEESAHRRRVIAAIDEAAADAGLAGLGDA